MTTTTYEYQQDLLRQVREAEPQCRAILGAGSGTRQWRETPAPEGGFFEGREYRFDVAAGRWVDVRWPSPHQPTDGWPTLADALSDWHRCIDRCREILATCEAAQ